MDDMEKCWGILPNVSRSFALCIRILPAPLNRQMMLSYLVFRVIDTVEDSSAPLAAKKMMFAEFLSLLSRGGANDAASGACARKMLARLDYTYEMELLEALPSLVRAYFSLPSGARRAISKRARVMARGMCEFQKKPIETFADQDRYSYYVAGVIGHLFNDLLEFNGIITSRLKRQLSRYAQKFGLALQKVNILRDIADDIASHRYYWPKRLLAKYGLGYHDICSSENREKALAVLHEQIKDARAYIDAAMQYILLLPKKALQVRMFCLIPLFMAIESYVKCMNNADVFVPGKKVKISRECVGDIVAKSGMWGANNERLVKWFAASMGNVPGGITDFAVMRA
ncbi:MAG: squalene/phytoene synthase family protein [Candidatus Micrarchaeota archaeon]|nr:squalene/phytoene synthase family protein [Candidatus Micrarchaeota archaeon]